VALRLFEPTLANVRADLRPLYVADAEHGFRLDLIDLDQYVGGLKRALSVERQKVREQRHLISELRLRTEVISVGGE
jgi:hypothetical protein